LVKLLAEKHRNICVVGDDDQSIYRFRGATIENILNFEHEYPDARVIRLEQNYRSTSCILDAANAVIGNNRGRKGKRLWTDNGDGAKIRRHIARDEQDEARFIADTVLELMEAGDKFADCAVLYRINALSNTVENVFMRSGIPYKIIGGLKFYDRKEIKDVLAYLSVICNPDDNLRLRRIINEPKRGIGGTTVNRAAEIAEDLGVSLFEVISAADEYEPLSRAAAKLKKFAETIKELIKLSDECSLHETVELTLEKSGYLRSLEHGEKSAERTENVRELLSGILKYEQENEDAALAGYLEEIALVTDIDDYDQDADRVVMMTMHAAKGLEFKNVFLLGMEDGIFPGNQSIYAGEDELEEERRLAYVGITRAKKRLYILSASYRMLFGQTGRNRPSRFVGEIPDGLLEQDEPAYAPETPHHAGTGFPPPAYSPRKASVYTAPEPGGGYAAGDRVRHKIFGDGVITSADKMGGDTLLEIDFPAGVKKLMANFAKLTKI
ncbi:MAG TPA: ATP-dependent DNA helicase PcrA, partial [Ruminococcaceae bacterium]|nr:ATP-dependent DNA helicase PcrA [Oscillospiraceae bacterium]